MRLITPYTLKKLMECTEIYITDSDITEFVEEVPEGLEVLGPFSVEALASNVLSAQYSQPTYFDYKYKSIFLVNDEEVVGIINEDSYQRITCRNLVLRITFFIDSKQANIQYLGLVELTPYINEDSSWSKPTSAKNLVTTKEQAEERRGYQYTGKSLVFHGNTPYTLPFRFQNFGSRKIKYLLPNIIESRPTLCLIFSRDYVSINFSERKFYSNTVLNLRGLTQESDSEGAITRALQLFFDTVEQKDLITGLEREIPYGQYFYGIDYDTDLFVITTNEETFLGKSYEDIQYDFKDSIDDYLRFISEQCSVIYDQLKGRLLVIDKVNNTTYRYLVTPSNFCIYPGVNGIIIYVDSSCNSNWEILSSINSAISIDGITKYDKNNLIVRMFNQNFILRNQNLIALIDE